METACFNSLSLWGNVQMTIVCVCVCVKLQKDSEVKERVDKG